MNGLRTATSTLATTVARQRSLALRLGASCSSRRTMSTDESNQQQVIAPSKQLVYESKFGKRIKVLRRVSLASSVVSSAFLPASFLYESGVLPIAGQIALAGTVFFTSISSTIMLQLVAHPYVHQLYEEMGKTGPRTLLALRFNLFGNENWTRFRLDDADKKISHPFSSFKLKDGGNFYIFGENVADSELKAKLTKEGSSAQ